MRTALGLTLSKKGKESWATVVVGRGYPYFCPLVAGGEAGIAEVDHTLACAFHAILSNAAIGHRKAAWMLRRLHPDIIIRTGQRRLCIVSHNSHGVIRVRLCRLYIFDDVVQHAKTLR